MGVHIYCAVRAGKTPDPAIHGVGDAQVHVIGAGPVGLWASTHDHAVRASIDAVREHNRVVQSAMTPDATPVPLRFGQWFESDEDAVARTVADIDRWQTLLDRFAGRAEYGVRLLQDEGTAREMHPAPRESGTAYMTELARRSAQAGLMRREAERLAELISERAGTLLVESRIADVPGGGVAIAHLLRWDDITAYQSTVRSVRDAEPSLRLLFTGPWPPYSFVE